MTRWVCEKPMKGSFDNAEITLIIKGPIRFWAIYLESLKEEYDYIVYYAIPSRPQKKKRVILDTMELYNVLAVNVHLLNYCY